MRIGNFVWRNVCVATEWKTIAKNYIDFTREKWSLAEWKYLIEALVHTKQNTAKLFCLKQICVFFFRIFRFNDRISNYVYKDTLVDAIIYYLLFDMFNATILNFSHRLISVLSVLRLCSLDFYSVCN